MRHEVPRTLEQQTSISLAERFRDTVTNLHAKLGKVAVIGVVAAAALGAFTAEEAIYPAAAAADTLGYPDADATDCSATYEIYSWCKSGGPLPYRSTRLYDYRNCTDYVAWREGTIGVSVPTNLGNGGQWYDNASSSKRSITPAAWDAAVVPGNPGHVAFIESVNSDGTITVSEYNHDAMGNGDTRTGTAASMGFTEFVDFGVHPPPPPTLPTHRNIGDFNNDGITDATVFRPSDGTWHIQMLGLSYDYSYGQSGDIPVPGNYDSNHPSVKEIAVFRPSDNYWHIRGVGDYQFGNSGDIPVPGDYNGDGVTDIAVYRPSNGTWYIRTPYVGDFQYGQPGDIPVPGYYNNDNIEDIAVYRPSEGGWHIRGVGDFPYGASTDIPVPGDYNADGITEAAIYRPSEGGWHIRGVGDYPYGASTDIPVPGYYDKNAFEDIAVYRPSEGGWHLRGVGDFPYGTSTDIPAIQTLNAFLLKQYGLISGY